MFLNPGSNWWRLVLGVLLLAIAAGAFFLLSQSELFAIEEVRVEGNRLVATESILEAAGPILQGQSILNPPTEAVSDALGSMSYIESVEFDRDLPDAITIRVQEYRPLACLSGADGSLLLISTQGTVLSPVETNEQSYPVIRISGECSSEVGAMVECDEAATALHFLNNIPVNFNHDIKEVFINGSEVGAITTTGADINFGSLDDYELKFEVLRQLLSKSMASGKTVKVDVSVPERPVTMEV